jgi:hypothetical protein
LNKTRLRAQLATGVLVCLTALALSACGEGSAGGEEQKSASGGSAHTNGQIAFRQWFDPDQTEGALFTMNPDGNHVSQITHPPTAGAMMIRCGLRMGRRSSSIARRSTRALAGLGS